jgi:hypothetical protein
LNQPLYLVFGGELADVTKTDFVDPSKLHTVGVFSTYKEAEDEWRGNMQRTVDNAQMRYFIVSLPNLSHP